MEQLELILMYIASLLSVVAAIIGIIALSKEDNYFNGLTHESDDTDEAVVSIENWLNSSDGKKLLNQSLNSTVSGSIINSFLTKYPDPTKILLKNKTYLVDSTLTQSL